MMEDVKVNIGELFKDLDHRDEKKKLKPNHEIQKLLACNFQKLTDFSVPHSRFLNVCKTYVNKIKKNNGRNEISVVMKDYFEKSVNIAVESSTAAPSSSLPLPSFSVASSQSVSGCTTPVSSPMVHKRVTSLKRARPSKLAFSPATPSRNLSPS